MVFYLSDRNTVILGPYVQSRWKFNAFSGKRPGHIDERQSFMTGQRANFKCLLNNRKLRARRRKRHYIHFFHNNKKNNNTILLLLLLLLFINFFLSLYRREVSWWGHGTQPGVLYVRTRGRDARRSVSA